MPYLQCECGVWVHDDHKTKAAHQHAVPAVSPDAIRVKESLVCTYEWCEPLVHAAVCSCKEREWVDKVQAALDITWRMHDRRGGAVTNRMQWQDFNDVTSACSALLRKIIN